MSKWSNEFLHQYHEVGTVKKLTKEIKDAVNKKKMQKEVDLNISKVCKGAVARKIKCIHNCPEHQWKKDLCYCDKCLKHAGVFNRRKK